MITADTAILSVYYLDLSAFIVLPIRFFRVKDPSASFPDTQAGNTTPDNRAHSERYLSCTAGSAAAG